MTPGSTSDSSSIFKDGKVKPGIYKIQNLYHQGYVDIQEYSRKLHTSRDLENRRGLWEIQDLGVGYTIKRVEPGKPDQFCNPLDGLENGVPIYVAAYSVAWRIEVVNDDAHRGFEYVRIHWGPTKRAWDGCNSSGNQVHTWIDEDLMPWRVWKLIPVKVEGMPTPSQPITSETHGSSSLPPYLLDATEQCPTQTQHSECERDDFGTIVTEVTTITTRKRYRVEEA